MSEPSPGGGAPIPASPNRDGPVSGYYGGGNHYQSDVPLTGFEEQLMRFLSIHPGQTKTEIAEALFPVAKNRGVRIKQINTAMYGMERRGLVHRHGTKEDTLKPFWFCTDQSAGSAKQSHQSGRGPPGKREGPVTKQGTLSGEPSGPDRVSLSRGAASSSSSPGSFGSPVTTPSQSSSGWPDEDESVKSVPVRKEQFAFPGFSADTTGLGEHPLGDGVLGARPLSLRDTKLPPPAMDTFSSQAPSPTTFGGLPSYSAFAASPLGSPAKSPMLPCWSSNIFGFNFTSILILLNLDHFASQSLQISTLFQRSPLLQQQTTLAFSFAASVPIPTAWRIDSSVATAEMFLSAYIGILLCHPRIDDVQKVIVCSRDAKAVVCMLESFGVRGECVLNPAQNLLKVVETALNT